MEIQRELQTERKLIAASRRVLRFILRRETLASIVLLGLAGIVGLSLYLARQSSLPAPFVSELPDTGSIQRLLVIAPHSDDETISSGELIHEVIKAGGHVRVVIVTNGDGSFSGTILELRRLYPGSNDYVRAGINRQRESLAAMETLGVSQDDVIFLSYPDRGTMPLWDRFWSDSAPYFSPFTRLNKSPYPRTFNPNAAYSGHSLLTDLRTIVRDFQPDTVILPYPEDIHPDHWATGAFASLAVQIELGESRPRLLFYLVHRADYPLPRGRLPFAPLLPPLRLVNPVADWGKVTLSVEARDLKEAAVEQYKSQLPLLGKFLRSFVRSNELFCVLNQPPVLRLTSDQPVDPNPMSWREVDGLRMTPTLYDSSGDTVSQQAEHGADFVALYVARTARELWVAAETRGTASRLASFVSLVRSVNGNEVERTRTVYSSTLSARPRTEAVNRFVLLRFDLQEMGNPRILILHVSSQMPGGTLMDRIGWVLLNLKD